MRIKGHARPQHMTVRDTVPTHHAALPHTPVFNSRKVIKNTCMAQSFNSKICLSRIIFAILHLLCSFQFR